MGSSGWTICGGKVVKVTMLLVVKGAKSWAVSGKHCVSAHGRDSISLHLQ